jgi:hypothetical protein
MVEVKNPHYSPESVVLGPKERTAISILYGLRQKFSREANKDPQMYTSTELQKLLSELMTNLNKNEVEIYERTNYIENDLKTDDPVWGVIDEAIEKSKIKRYRWKSFFDKSLTQVILELKKRGLSPQKAFQEIIKNEKIQKFIEQHSSEKDKMLCNIRISVYARYGESNTEEKILNGDTNGDQ